MLPKDSLWIKPSVTLKCKLIQPLWKTVWRFLKKKKKKIQLGIKPSYDPAIPLRGIYPEETEIEKDTCIPSVHYIYNS